MLLLTLANGVWDAEAPGAVITVGTGFLPGRARPEFDGAAGGTTWEVGAGLVAGQGAGDAAAPGVTLGLTTALAPGGATGGALAPGVTLTATAGLVPGEGRAHLWGWGLKPRAIKATVRVGQARVVTQGAVTGRLK